MTELLSGSLPASEFFRPPVFLFLTTVGYGFPILLLREFAVRRRLGLLGLLALGLVYGIFNEGIIAKTFYLAANVPIRNFDGYGYTGGIAVPWAINISLWHALHAWLYPLAAVYYFFPGHRESPWLSWKGIALLAIPTVVIGALVFFNREPDREAGQPGHFILMLAAGGGLVWLATKLPAAPALGGGGMFQIPAIFWGGLGFLVLILGPVLLAGVKAPVILFHGYYGVCCVWITRWLRKRELISVTTLLLFAMGNDALLVMFGIVGGVEQGSIQRLITSAFFLAIFAGMIMRLRKSAR